VVDAVNEFVDGDEFIVVGVECAALGDGGVAECDGYASDEFVDGDGSAAVAIADTRAGARSGGGNGGSWRGMCGGWGRGWQVGGR
jgi:hypothetical protein